ncbi:hypothetical protein DXG01_000952 [Tephrocybe rancida]|nr:hypothetical protein DXG01_000952 [Tephrocybe rancida]
MSDTGDLNCGEGGGSDTFRGLRIASIFIILIGSLMGATFPIVAKRSAFIQVPKSVFDFAKYFGSGVIIATAFIHLLSPALDALGSDCLSDAWKVYPYALALCLLSIFSIFIVELIAFRWGTAKLKRLGLKHDAHGHGVGSHVAHGPESTAQVEGKAENSDVESQHSEQVGPMSENAMAQVIGVAILEFGVALHSVLVGLTLAVDEDFKVLFVVLVFHQTFEGLGVGSRLAYMRLPRKYNWVAYVGAIIYGVTTPIGIAAGIGVRSTYNPGSTTASIVSGVMDSLSAGILIYTGLVEATNIIMQLLAHEFLFNKQMIESSNGHLAYALICMLAGCGIMALLGRWA